MRGEYLKIPLPDSYGYIGIFLTMECPYWCSYCINRHEPMRTQEIHLNVEQWVTAISRIVRLRRRGQHDIPITLQGGEPTMHPGFFDIINELPVRYKIDVLTNLAFGADEWIEKLKPHRVSRKSPYANIRISYHPECVRLETFCTEVLKLKQAKFNICVYVLDHPDHKAGNIEARDRLGKLGVKVRHKEFLGYHDEILYGSYKYPDACDLKDHETIVRCKNRELLIDPKGDVYRCHHDLYQQINPVGNMLDPDWVLEDIYRPCIHYGRCNPCDVKVKNNYMQKFGYTAVDIQFPE